MKVVSSKMPNQPAPCSPSCDVEEATVTVSSEHATVEFEGLNQWQAEELARLLMNTNNAQRIVIETEKERRIIEVK